jgi:hypothetical protein
MARRSRRRILHHSLDDRDRDIGLVIEDVVNALTGSALRHPAANHDAAVRDVDLLAELRLHVPSGALDRGRDELRADVALRKGLLVQDFEGTPGLSR